MATAPDLRRQLLQRVDALRRSGVTTVPRYRGNLTPILPAVDSQSLLETSPVPVVDGQIVRSEQCSAEPTSTTAAKPIARPSASPSPVLHAESVATSGDTLDRIRVEVAACTRCRELACTRTQTVFGVGNPNARLCFLGEAPGADEDRRGEPFVGRAGQLLDKIIEACTLKREEVYILNILKCRPPGNRNPDPQESANCRPFLDRQLALIKPEFLCCLGAVAARNLLASEESIGKMRGRVFDYHGIKVVCTYHPAYLLRNPSAKRDTWEDMQMLMKLMGVPLPGRQ